MTIIIFLLSFLGLSDAFIHASVSLRHKRPTPVVLEAMQVWCDARDLDEGDLLPELDEEPDLWLPPCCKNKSDPILRDAQGEILGKAVTLDTPDGQQQAMEALGMVEWVYVESTGDCQMIPAENLIAAAQSSGTQLAFRVNKTSDVGGLARALELGVDALAVHAKAPEDVWKAVWQARQERNSKDKATVSIATTPQIVSGSCWRRTTTDTVLADRICIDLVQQLLPEEGCWVGSSAKCMALVLSEAASSQYVPTRPFRVNAGPVHSYVLMADGSTKYLCELEASDKVEVYNAARGTSRPIAVGRLKQEVRPCVLVELQHGEVKGQVFLQQAETVRLGQDGGTFVRATDLEAQDEGLDTSPVQLRTTMTGTHIGKRYTGQLKER